MKSLQTIKHHPVKTAFAVVGFLLLIAAVCYGINFKRTLNRVVAWEELNEINYRLHDYLTDHQDLPLSDDIHRPTDVSHLIGLVMDDWPFGKSANVCHDRWGTPMKFQAVHINDKNYFKGLSAGPDRQFNTTDDVINSQFDDTSNIFSPVHHLKYDFSKDKPVKNTQSSPP